MNSAVDQQRQLNLSTAGAWSWYASHRAYLWSVIAGASQSRSDLRRLCLLGAGNVNDVDLVQALTVFEEVHLVDLDGEAMRGALVRQGLAGSPRIVLRGDVDLCGARVDGDAFDVVVSCCVLSQIVDRVVHELGPKDPRTAGVVLAERDGHLAKLMALAAPGGAAVLVTDFVSSDTVPGLLNRANLDEEHVARLVSAGNFFAGCNPYVLRRLLQALPAVTGVVGSSPWVWRISSDRSYAVAAFVAYRGIPKAWRRTRIRDSRGDARPGARDAALLLAGLSGLREGCRQGYSGSFHDFLDTEAALRHDIDHDHGLARLHHQTAVSAACNRVGRTTEVDTAVASARC